MTYRPGDPWSGTTYHGFAGGRGDPARAPAAAPPAYRPPARRPSPRAWLIGGVGGALALGLILGLWAKPELGGPAPSTPPRPPTADALPSVPGPSAMRANPAPAGEAASAMAPSAGVPIAINPPPPPPPTPRPIGRLEVLPPEMARAARAQGSAAVARTPSVPAQATAIAVPAPASPAPAALGLPAAIAAPPLQASFDCAAARPGAEQAVCSDPALAAADARLARAYRRALRAGVVDPADLNQEQQDWLAIREDAARRSPRALASVYQQRLGELEAIAANGAADVGN